MAALEVAIKNAADFITPFLDDEEGDLQQKQDWLSKILLEDASGVDQRRAIEEIVRKALSLLEEIHKADLASPAGAPYPTTLVARVSGLVDLITLQGIRPSIFASAKYARRPQSVLLPVVSTVTPQNIPFLSEVMGRLCAIVDPAHLGIAPLIIERACSIIVIGASELAYSPSVPADIRNQSKPQLSNMLRGLPVSAFVHIVPLLSAQGSPPWLTGVLSVELSQIPLRPHGVRQLLNLLSTIHGSTGALNEEAIKHANDLLVKATPVGMPKDEYIAKVAPQLLALLDEEAGVDMYQAAGQIIANMLTRKSLGARGTMGWKMFAEPIQQAFNPTSEEDTTKPKTSGAAAHDLDRALVQENSLRQALTRLAILTYSHPHPNLAKRLISPIVLPLWGLLNYAKKARIPEPLWTSTAHSVLLRYFQITDKPQYLDLIASNLLWDGKPTWTFGPGSGGGVEIRRRPQNASDYGNVQNIIAGLEALDGRIAAFNNLLVNGEVDDDVAISIFMSTTKRWLHSARDQNDSSPSLSDEREVDPLEVLTNAKLAEAMTPKLKTKFASHPKHVIELAATFLEDFLNEHKAKEAQERQKHNSKYASLGNIVTKSEPENEHLPPSASNSGPEEDLVAFSLSLVYTTISDVNFKMTAEIDDILARIPPVLEFMGSKDFKGQLTVATCNAANNLIALVNSKTSGADSSSSEPFVQSRATLLEALVELQSPEPPIRAHALSVIRTIADSLDESHFIDIPSTTQTILSLSLSDPDSYVHTAAIPTLISLAALAPALATGILTAAFLDEDETTLKLASNAKSTGEDKGDPTTAALDLRLRIGETLHSTLSSARIWAAPTASRALHTIIDTILTLSSRRGPNRPATLSTRQTAAADQIRIREEAEEAWGGEVPTIPLSGDEEPETEQQAREREVLERIVQGWGDTGLEEDVRVRASALSILGSALELRLVMVRQEQADKAIEVVLGSLVLERGAEKAILRRAAVLVVLGLLKGLDARLERGRSGEAGARVEPSVEKWGEVERVLKWVASEDGDELVRGHADVVLEGLETWGLKSWFGVKADVSEGHSGLGRLSMGLAGGLRGLAVDLDKKENEEGKRIIEELD